MEGPDPLVFSCRGSSSTFFNLSFPWDRSYTRGASYPGSFRVSVDVSQSPVLPEGDSVSLSITTQGRLGEKMPKLELPLRFTLFPSLSFSFFFPVRGKRGTRSRPEQNLSRSFSTIYLWSKCKTNSVLTLIVVTFRYPKKIPQGFAVLSLYIVLYKVLLLPSFFLDKYKITQMRLVIQST